MGAKPTTERRRSQYVAYGIMGAVVLACCGSAGYQTFFQRKTCVDPRTYQRIDQTYCGSGGTGRWYYGGSGGRGIGSKVNGGSFERGGFGGHFGGGS